jgi:hypothetical protein
MNAIRGLRASDLGNYSVFSLQFLDRLLLISVVLANNFEAVIKASKLELLMQLDSKLVDVKISDNGCFVKHTLDLQRDIGAEGHASGATEGQVHTILSVFIGGHMLGHSERHREGGFGLASNFLLNRQAENINRKFKAGLVIGEGQGAVRLPGPVGVVEDFKLDGFSSSWDDLNGLLRLALADGTSFLPALLALEVPLGAHVLVPLRSTLTNLLLPLLISPVLTLTVLEFVQEFVDHVLERVTVFAHASASTGSFAASLAEGLQHLADESHRVLIPVQLTLSFLLVLGLFFIDDNHNIWGLTRCSDFEHSVVMTLTLFTGSAEVEVLLDGGLVANAADGLPVRAAIAVHTLMDGLSLFSCHVNISEILRLDKSLEEFLGLFLELLVNEVLNGFSFNAKFLHLGLLTFDLFLSLWERSVGLPNGEDQLHAAVIASKLEGHLHIVIILNDNPIVTIVISKLDFIGADLVLGGELVGRGD